MEKRQQEALERVMQTRTPRQHARTREESMAAIDRAQAIARQVIPRDRLLADEWLAEKRSEWGS